MVSSIPETQAPRRLKPDPDALVGHIEVAGNVPGNITVGNENVVGSHNVVYHVHTDHGGLVNITHGPSSVTPRPMHGQRLRAPRGFTGRASYLKKLEDNIQSNEAVLVYGQDGIGKTALLAQASNSAAALSRRDGVVLLEGIDNEGKLLGKGDIIQRLFDSLFDANPPLKVTSPTARPYLSNTEPLVILDHLDESIALHDLPNLFPGGALLVASQAAPDHDSFLPVHIQPLTREESIQLLSNKAGVALDETTRAWIDQICELLGDVPLAITRTANTIQRNQLTLEAVAGSLAAIQPPSLDKVQAAIERSLGMIYPALPSQARDMLAIAAAAPGTSVDRPWLESVAGGEAISQPLEELELLYTNSPRLRAPDGMREILQGARKDLQAQRELLLRHLLDELKFRSMDFKFVADELGNILGLIQWASDERRWSDVVALGRAVDPYLTLSGLWDAWESVLRQILVAAQNLKDLALRAWVLHQLGTRAIGIGTRSQAIDLLWRALTIRLSQGNLVGAAYTLHNLRLLLPPDDQKDVDTLGPDGGQGVRIWEQIWNSKNYNPWLLVGALIAAAVVAVAALQPFMRLTIQASPSTYNPVGQVIEYNYRVENAGFAQLNGPILVTTNDQSEVICPDVDTIGNQDHFLDWNESVTCTSFHSITESDVQSGSVTNTATARAADSRVRATRSLTSRREDRYVMFNIETDRRAYRNAGDTITVAYLVKNVGNVALGGPVTIIGEKLKAKCPNTQQIGDGNGFLDGGERLACTASFKITDVDVQAGSWTDTATVSIGDFTSAPQSITVYGIAPSQLILRKFAQREIYRDVGEPIRYTYMVGNQGKEPLKGPVTISDDKVEVTCQTQDELLNPGEVVMCSADYTITAADIENGSVTNTAYARADQIVSEKQSITIVAVPRGETRVLSLRKTANLEKYSVVGQPIEYTYEVTNQGTDALKGPVIVSDDKAEVTCEEQDDMLQPGELFTCRTSYTITESDMITGSVTNTARASIGDIRSEPQSTTVYLEVPQPVLLKSVDSETFQEIDEKITYTYVVTHSGTLPLNGPVDIRDDKIQADCSPIILVALPNPALNPGESFTCTKTYTITEADVRNRSVTNTAWAIVGNRQSKPQSITIYLKKPLDPPILRLTRSADPQTYAQAGEEIAYIYLVANAGKGPAKGPVTIDDDKVTVRCPALDGIGDRDGALDLGEQLACTGIYTTTEADLGNGSVTSTASARAGEVTSKPVSVTIYARALGLDIAADPQTYIADDQIQYSYVLKGNSKLPLSGPVAVEVTGGQPQTNCPNVNTVGNLDDFLDWEEKITCEGRYSLTQEDIDRRSVTNTAIAMVSDVNSRSVSFTIEVPEPKPALTLTNTANPESYNTVRQIITYTYVVTNNGDRTLNSPFRITADRITNNEPFECIVEDQRLAPQESTTCSNEYAIAETDFNFGNSAVITDSFTSAQYRGQSITSAAVTTTIICPYPGGPGWIPYTIFRNESLAQVSGWYAAGQGKTVEEMIMELQKNNCMGTSTYTYPGQMIYVPGAWPAATVSGVIRDTERRPIDGVLVRLINNGSAIDQTRTNANGSYTLSAPNPGDYRIFQVAVTLLPGDNVSRDFVIVPETP